MTAAVEVDREIAHILLETIDPDPAQPRAKADDELWKSINQVGVLQPITVRVHPENGARFMIVDGERRWRGAVQAGLLTIPAIVGPGLEDRAQRLIRQTTFNTGKPLTPIEEAKAWKEIQELTGANIAQLAKMLGRKKSTVSDRIAIAEAPAPFLPLFEKGILTAAAAPIARKFAGVPAEALAAAVEDAQDDVDWKAATERGEPVPLDDVEGALHGSLRRSLREVQSWNKEYSGPRVTIGEHTYATDVEAFDAAQAAAKSKEKAATKAKREEASPQKKAAEKRAADNAAKEAARQARENRQWVGAGEQIRTAIAAAIKKAPADATGKLAAFILRDGVAAGTEKLVPQGKTAVDLIRYMVMGGVLDNLLDACSARPYPQWARDRVVRDVKALGLGVDVLKIVRAFKVDEASPAKQKGRAKGKR